MDAIGQARERIAANVAPLLAVEALMVQLSRSASGERTLPSRRSSG